MEQLNKVELRGTVGNAQINTVGGKTVGRFTVATNVAYKDSLDCPVIETTWHTVTAWEGKDISNLDKIGRGSKVSIVGRLRNQRYTGSSGEERYVTEILANSIHIISDTESLQCQV